MHSNPFSNEEEEIKELAELAYWEENKDYDEEEQESYDEWLMGEIAFWGYNR